MALVEKLDHVGIVVEDLAGVSQAFEILLGVEPERREIPEARFAARIFRVSESDVEVLRFQEPIEGVDPSVFETGTGIQHLAFRVANLGEALEVLKARGVEPLRGFPRAGVHGTIAFLREPVTGVLLELVER